MNKLRNILAVYIFFTLTLSGVSGQVKQSEISSAERKIKLSWEEVDGAVSYKIVIKDLKGNTIIDKESDSNNFTLELQPDNYKIRIGSVNKFRKIGSWSDWADLIIEKPVVKPAGKEKEMSKDEVLLNFKIGIGGSYFVIQPDWNKYYKDSFNAYSLDIAYAFHGSNIPVLKYLGLDIESNYVKFTGKAAYNKIGSDMTNIISGINFFISTNFDFPINFAVRGGGGLSYTMLDYKKYDNTGNLMEKGTSNTSALYYKAGVSVEYRFYSRFFLEGYADYYSINYLAMDFKSLRFSCLAGFHF
jgi:hypothetical protein